MSFNLKVVKIKNVKTPVRSTLNSVGVDFYVPNYTDEFLNDFIEKNDPVNYSIEHDANENEWKIIIHHSGNILIPSGLRVSFPKEYCLIAFNKSSVAFKKGLIVGACVIDADYPEELYINLINTGRKSVEIKLGQKIVQFLIMPAIYAVIETCDEKELEVNQTERTGGFGSTGVN